MVAFLDFLLTYWYGWMAVFSLSLLWLLAEELAWSVGVAGQVLPYHRAGVRPQLALMETPTIVIVFYASLGLSATAIGWAVVKTLA